MPQKSSFQIEVYARKCIAWTMKGMQAFKDCKDMYFPKNEFDELLADVVDDAEDDFFF